MSGDGTGGAASIGVSIARNFIGATQSKPGESGGSPTLANGGDGNRTTATISGTSGNSLGTLKASGAIRVEASHSATIKAEVVAVSAAIAASTSGSGALSGAGSEATNVIASSTTATIIGSGTVSSDLVGTDLTIDASDAASINATAVGASLAASFAGSNAIAPSIGISLATNTIRRNTKAELANFGSVLPKGNVVITSTNTGTINSESIAAAIAVAVGGKFSLGLSGGGTSSLNTITGTNQALINSANLGTASSTWNGTVTVSANDTSEINAKVKAFSFAVAVGYEHKATSAAIGVALARNLIGETQNNSVSGGDSPQAFTNQHSGKGNLIRSAITNSNIYAKGAVSVTASHGAKITSFVDSFAAAISATNGNSIALVGAGSKAINRSLVAIQAFLGASSNKTISLNSGTLSVSSSDTTSADSTSWGAAVGFSLGGSGSLAAAIGVSQAHNTLDNSAASTVTNIAAGSKVAALAVTASKTKAKDRSASISAKSAAVAVALSGGSSGGSLAGGGADAINILLGDTTTSISTANLTVAGAISLGSSNSQSVDAGVGAGVGAGSATGVGGAIAVGAVKVQNLLGIATADATNTSRAKVQTTISNSNLTTTGTGVVNPDLTASSSSTVSYGATAIPVSVALTTGQFAGAFSGAFNDSRIAFNVGTTVTQSNLISAGSLTITSKTDNNIDKAQTDAGSVAISGNPGIGVGVAIGAAENKNLIDNINTVTISDGGSNVDAKRYTIQSKGDLAIKADDARSTINDSKSTTAVVSGGIIALSGGGARIKNTIANVITTTVTGAIDVNAGVIGDATVMVETTQLASATQAQVDQVVLDGHFNSGDKIVIKVTTGNTELVVTYQVTSPTALAIQTGLRDAINNQIGTSYLAAISGNSINTITITAKQANRSFRSELTSTPAVTSSGSITIAASSSNANLNAEIVATSLAAGMGVAVGAEWSKTPSTTV